MSRLPRLQSSPTAVPPTITTRKRAAAEMQQEQAAPTSRKRKAVEDDEDEDEARDQPRKLPAIGIGRAKPLQPSRSTTNTLARPTTRSVSGGSLGKSNSARPKLTVPSGPAPSRSTNLGRSTRGTSAPPAGASSVKPPSRPGFNVSTTRKPPSSSTSTTQPPSTHRLSVLHSRLETLEAHALAADMDAERAKAAAIQSTLVAQREEHLAGRRALAAAQDELADGKRAWAREREELEAEGRRRDRELRELGEDLRMARADLERARCEATELRAAVSAGTTAQLTLQAQKAALEARCEALASQLEAVTTGKENVAKENEDLRAEVARLKAEAVKHEEIRRRMHNEIQELKGNIRVFCRVRPPLGENEGEVAEMAFPDDPAASGSSSAASDSGVPSSGSSTNFFEVPRQLNVRAPGESATGASRPESHQFAFDRVFGPSSTQDDIFADVADLTQSAVDGFNVCVFAYGQTGSGKSFTMEGGPTPATRGLIPRAVDALFETAEGLKGQGWEWEFEGRFLEIYNETIHDLLAPVDKNDLKSDSWGQDKKGEQKEKHSIKHDPRTGQTHVTGATTLPLPSPAAVRGLLARAAARRSVAATMANSRSSRSHAVFTVKVVGRRGGSTSAPPNGSTTPPGEPQSRAGSVGSAAGGGETRIGALHLVDLAGSERLAHSGVGDAGLVNGVNVRLKETQAINKSLSALGDVIAALGERGAGGERHIPYRNSKLTYLLQNSLGGNSKTLMIVNVSPLAAHLGETLTSLRFATKVNNTTIGTARRVVK